MILKNKRAGALTTTFLFLALIGVIGVAITTGAFTSFWTTAITSAFILGDVLLLFILNTSMPAIEERRTPFIVLIILLTLGAMSYGYSKIPPDDHFIGVVSGGAKAVASFMDSGFKSLFGNSFVASLNSIAGVRTGSDFWIHFGLSLLTGFIAFCLVYLGSLYMNRFSTSTDALKSVKKFPGKAVWLEFLGGSFDKVVIFTLMYATLSQIGVVNRVIEIITFYWLVNWFMYPIVLAVIIGYLPEILIQINEYRNYMKEQRALIRMKAGIKAIKAAGKA